MDANLLAKQSETYSNAIVTFIVIQGLSYVYAFGTSPFFNCLVKTSNFLAEGMVALFILITILSLVAIRFLGRTLENISGEFRGIVHKIYLAKSLVVLIFAVMQISITIGYGVLSDSASTDCRPVKEALNKSLQPTDLPRIK